MIEQSAHSFLASVAAAVVWAATSIAADAQPAPFPSGTIQFVAPISASTPPDIVSRIVAKELSGNQGWRVIVENRPGGMTTIAADRRPVATGEMALQSTRCPHHPLPVLLWSRTSPFRPRHRLRTGHQSDVSYNVLVVNPSVPANLGG